MQALCAALCEERLVMRCQCGGLDVFRLWMGYEVTWEASHDASAQAKKCAEPESNRISRRVGGGRGRHRSFDWFPATWRPLASRAEIPSVASQLSRRTNRHRMSKMIGCIQLTLISSDLLLPCSQHPSPYHVVMILSRRPTRARADPRCNASPLALQPMPATTTRSSLHQGPGPAQ